MYAQIQPFDPSKGGHTPGLCLQNVRLGYGIPNKYANATDAWNHTVQHRDRNIPQGVAVPLFYSYITVNGNEGHINVQLPDGRVWSDGNYYANLDAYLQTHAPKLLGWGESVNDVRVIQGDQMLDDEGAKEVYRSTLHREPENDQVWRPYVGRPFSEVSKEFRNSQEWKNQDTAIKEYPGLVNGQGDFIEVLTAGQPMYVKKGQ